MLDLMGVYGLGGSVLFFFRLLLTTGKEEELRMDLAGVMAPLCSPGTSSNDEEGFKARSAPSWSDGSGVRVSGV